jgi:hypothetical protein
MNDPHINIQMLIPLLQEIMNNLFQLINNSKETETKLSILEVIHSIIEQCGPYVCDKRLLLLIFIGSVLNMLGCF